VAARALADLGGYNTLASTNGALARFARCPSEEGPGTASLNVGELHRHGCAHGRFRNANSWTLQEREMERREH
jgi:hypothetical protein